MSDRDILAELRVRREEFARTHGYDLAAMGETLRKLDAAAGGRLVGGEPRKPSASSTSGGEAMVAALEGLAAAGGPSGIGDPVEWQRESRTDRVLPGREE